MPVSNILLYSDKTKLYCANISAFRALKFLEDINIFLGGGGNQNFHMLKVLLYLKLIPYLFGYKTGFSLL